MKNELFNFIYSIFEEKINTKNNINGVETVMAAMVRYRIIQTSYNVPIKTMDIIDQIDTEKNKVQKYISQYDNEPSMAKVINKILDENNLVISDLVKKLDCRQARQTFYRLASFSNASSAKKDTLICLAFCANASLEQLERLLNSSGYILAKNNQDDMLVKYCFENHKVIEFYEGMKTELFGESTI